MRNAFRIAVIALGAVAVVGCAMDPKPFSIEEKLARTRANWTPGSADFIPGNTLDMYPCHSAELPCGRMAPPPVDKVDFKGPLNGDAKKGEAIAINIRYGNCIACHDLPKGYQGGTIGPSLANYGKRNLSIEYTYQRIWDTRVFNPNAFMPIYGPNAVLTVQEIQDVIAFLEAGK